MFESVRRTFCTLSLLLIIVAPLVAEEPSKELAAQDSLGQERYSEVLDDPPAAFAARDDRTARTPGMRATEGPYVSVQVNVDESGQNIVGDAANEPSIAINPTDPSNMVIGWRQFDTISSNFRQAGNGHTFDGGQTWFVPNVIEPGIFRSDPVLAPAAGGAIFYQSLTIENGNDFILHVFRSTNGGATWPTKTFAWGGDKNWMVIDRTSGPGRGHIYEIWQLAAACCGNNAFSRSVDSGASFENPVPIDFWPLFGTMDIGPDGAVYAVGIDGRFGQDFDTFTISKTTNAEDSGTSPTFNGRIIDMGGSMRLSASPNPGGLLGQATVAVSHAAGASHNNVYVVASVNPPGGDPLDVHFIRSTDGGLNWSAPVKVNDDASSNHWQWFGAVSVGPRGRIDVAWNDTRDAGQSSISQLYYSYSWDQGLTWSTNVAASPAFNSLLGHPNQNKMGDYLDMRSDITGADVAYAATFNGEQDVYYVRLFPDCNDNAASDIIDISTGVSADCNINKIPDECEAAPQCVGSGDVPDGHRTSGDQLHVNLLESGDLELSWAISCLFIDNDYEIYEGSLDGMYDHAPVYCTTGGQTTSVLEPAQGHDTYYLVVPTNTSQEGSYGRDSAGAIRPTSGTPCRPQQIVPCFDSGGF